MSTYGPDLLSKRRAFHPVDLAEHERPEALVTRTEYCADPEHCTHHDMPVLPEDDNWFAEHVEGYR